MKPRKFRKKNRRFNKKHTEIKITKNIISQLFCLQFPKQLWYYPFLYDVRVILHNVFAMILCICKLHFFLCLKWRPCHDLTNIYLVTVLTSFNLQGESGRCCFKTKPHLQIQFPYWKIMNIFCNFLNFYF